MKIKIWGDLPGSLEVKISPLNAGAEGSIPGQGAKILTCLLAKNKNKNKTKQDKTQSRSNMVANAVKILKAVHIKNSLLIKQFWRCHEREQRNEWSQEE